MSRFRKLSQTLWHCQYHIIWVPKYRLQILEGKLADEISSYVLAYGVLNTGPSGVGYLFYPLKGFLKVYCNIPPVALDATG
jgi:putative transposase